MTAKMYTENGELRPPKAILFDFGDTLVKTMKWDPRAGTERILQHADKGADISVDTVQQLAEELIAEVDERRIASGGLETSTLAFHRLLYDRLGITFRLPETDIEFEFWKGSVEHVAEEGIEDVLQILRDAGIPAGVVSNTGFRGEVIESGLQQFGLLEYFQFVMASCDYGFRKPHPLLYLTAAAKLGLDPADIWFAGNWRPEDVAGALSAGMGAIWYNGRSMEQDGPLPHAEIRHWNEFPDLLRVYLA